MSASEDQVVGRSQEDASRDGRTVGDASDGRDISGETVMGMRVAAWSWEELNPLPDPATLTRYAGHWSGIPERAERLFRESDVRKLLSGSADFANKTFLISPVRGHAPDKWAHIVAELEADGWSVHWPARDTDQTDPIGLDICSANRAAIASADCVHVIWDGLSSGCLFDLGMAFALGKRVIPISLPSSTPGKSFQNMVLAWSER